MRQRWFGATGRRVPQIAVEGDESVPITPETLVLDDVGDVAALRRAHELGRPVVVHADTAEGLRQALARPEVACVLVPPSARDLLEVDLTKLTYG